MSASVDYRASRCRRSPWGEPITRCPKCGARGVRRREWIAGPVSPRWIDGEQGPRIRPWCYVESFDHVVGILFGGLARGIREHCQLRAVRLHAAPEAPAPAASLAAS